MTHGVELTMEFCKTMPRLSHHSRAIRALLLLMAFVGCAAVWMPRTALAVSHESPEVRALVDRGLRYLETASDGRVGGKCLIGLCFLKNGRDGTHARVQEAVKACYDTKLDHAVLDNYSLGIAVMFLCEADPSAHANRIQEMMRALLGRQMANGGWSYADHTTGDTSQTQYAVLAIWLACREAGMEVPVENVDKVAAWLMRTQDPNGAWGYQGVDPGNLQHVPQDKVSLSLSAAGLGSLYVCYDLLRMKEQADKDSNEGRPEALKVVEEKGKGKKLSSIDPKTMRSIINLGQGWFNKNYKIEQGSWNSYYIYALERCNSYRELAEGKFEKEPGWYQDGFKLLSATVQAAGAGTPNSGSFWKADQDTDVTATCFHVLFLSRSSRKAITKVVGNLGDGTLLGGMGLPPSTADIREKNGKLVEAPLSGSIDDILSIVEDPDNPELARMVDSAQAISLDVDDSKRESQILRLRKMVSAGNYESRVVAVRSLSRVRELDNVPVLIYALTDPDIRIVREADKGLRFISRKLSGMGPLDNPTKEQTKAIWKSWREWYLSIRPDAEFID